MHWEKFNLLSACKLHPRVAKVMCCDYMCPDLQAARNIDHITYTDNKVSLNKQECNPITSHHFKGPSQETLLFYSSS